MQKRAAPSVWSKTTPERGGMGDGGGIGGQSFGAPGAPCAPWQLNGALYLFLVLKSLAPCEWALVLLTILLHALVCGYMATGLEHSLAQWAGFYLLTSALRISGTTPKRTLHHASNAPTHNAYELEGPFFMPHLAPNMENEPPSIVVLYAISVLHALLALYVPQVTLSYPCPLPPTRKFPLAAPPEPWQPPPSCGSTSPRAQHLLKLDLAVGWAFLFPLYKRLTLA